MAPSKSKPPQCKSTVNPLVSFNITCHDLIRVIPDILVVLDKAGRILFVNKTVAGIKMSEPIGKTTYDYVPKYYQKNIRDILKKVFTKGKTYSYETLGRGPNNTTSWYSTSVAPIKSGKKVVAAIQMSRDITEKKFIEQALLESENKNRALVSANPDLIFRINKDGTYLDYHAPRNFAPYVPPKKFMGKTIADVIPKDIAKRGMVAIRKALKTHEVQLHEYQLFQEGSYRDFESRVVAIDNNEVLVLVRDITELKRMEKEILEISDRVQRSIGQDLHDELSQHLTGIAFLSKVLEQKLLDKNLSESKEAQAIVGLVNQTISQTHSLAHGLHPVELETNGLIAVLQDLAASTENIYSIPCRFSFAPKNFMLKNISAATHLYRITQEAITNSIKHSKATQIAIKLRYAHNNLNLEIHDNGKGITKDKAQSGMGLNIMKYRARVMGATLDILPRKPRGTSIVCQLSKENIDHAK